MKTVSLLVAVFACLVLSGCFATEEDIRPERMEPRNYNEAMDRLRHDIQVLDKQVVANSEEAVVSARRVHKTAGTLGGFDPSRIERNYRAYEEFDRQADDLFRTSDRLLYYIEQRKWPDARDQLVDLGTRFNRLASNYGPAYQVSVLGMAPAELVDDPVEASDMPGDLRRSR